MDLVDLGDRSPEWHGFMEAFHAGGVHAALVFLNARTPHRYTGIYRYDGDIVRNVELVDKYDPEVRKGLDVPRSSAYCNIVGQTREPLEILDTGGDRNRYGVLSSPVISYCGVLILDEVAETCRTHIITLSGSGPTAGQVGHKRVYGRSHSPLFH